MNNDSPSSIAKALLGTAAMLFAHFVAGLVVFVVLSRIVPIYVQHCDAIGMELPAPALGVIKVSMLMAHYWYLPLVGFGVLDAAILLALDLFRPRARWLKSCWHTAVLLLAVILFLGFAAFALGMPFFRGPLKLA